MRNPDRLLTGVEFSKIVAAFDATDGNGAAASELLHLKRQFAWNQTDEFYQGFAKALFLAANLFHANRSTDRAVIGAMLLMLAGIVLVHPDGE
jgi:hypothetical protein